MLLSLCFCEETVVVAAETAVYCTLVCKLEDLKAPLFKAPYDPGTIKCVELELDMLAARVFVPLLATLPVAAILIT